MILSSCSLQISENVRFARSLGASSLRSMLKQDCFPSAKTGAEPLLWSHYGGKHRGICLGFNVPCDALEQVTYEDQRLRAELDANADPLQLPVELQRALRCTKYRNWQYERE